MGRQGHYFRPTALHKRENKSGGGGDSTTIDKTRSWLEI